MVRLYGGVVGLDFGGKDRQAFRMFAELFDIDAADQCRRRRVQVPDGNAKPLTVYPQTFALCLKVAVGHGSHSLPPFGYEASERLVALREVARALMGQYAL